MAPIVDIVGWSFLIAGSLFALIGALGVLRLPDVFARMHGAGIIDTLGAGLILLGLMVQAGFSLVTVKLILIFALLMITSPTSTHALARAALNGGVKPLLDDTKNGDGAPSKT